MQTSSILINVGRLEINLDILWEDTVIIASVKGEDTKDVIYDCSLHAKVSNFWQGLLESITDNASSTHFEDGNGN